jgi:ParB/Sulfiredoxin domain
MVVLSYKEKLDRIPVAPDVLEAIVHRVRLVDIDSLRRYERTNPAKVASILQSLRSTGVLINPVVVDPDRQLLIDGHHRAQAFRELGLDFIPAFTVDYLSDDLTVKGWNHAVDARPEELKRVIARLHGSSEGPWTVFVGDPHRHVVASRAFETVLEGARCLDDVAIRPEDNGENLYTEAEALQRGIIHSYIRPVVGKSDVIEMVEKGELFPREINRHLIEDRPLNLCTPLGAIDDEDRFRRHLDHACHAAKPPLAIEPGSRQGGRAYDERVVLFRTQAGGP